VSGLTDIHSHVLPGVDDGPGSWEESLALCRLLVAEGVRTVVATPHVIDGVYANTRRSVTAAVAELNRRLAGAGVPLVAMPGGEVAMTCASLTDAAHEPVPTLAGTRYVLIEIPSTVLPRSLDGLMFSLIARGTVPVIAHPERCRTVQENPRLARAWTEAGCYLQIDAESVIGLWGERARTSARELIGAGLAHALASDAHSCGRRPPRLREAAAVVAEIAGAPMAEFLVARGPTSLAAGRAPGPPPAPTLPQRPRGWLDRILRR